MNLVDLIVTVCLLAHPQNCQNKHLVFQAGGSLRSCMFQAQFQLARWSGEHPEFKIVRWRCAWPDQEGKNT